jgi:hypothetical protein
MFHVYRRIRRRRQPVRDVLIFSTHDVHHARNWIAKRADAGNGTGLYIQHSHTQTEAGMPCRLRDRDLTGT